MFCFIKKLINEYFYVKLIVKIVGKAVYVLEYPDFYQLMSGWQHLTFEQSVDLCPGFSIDEKNQLKEYLKHQPKGVESPDQSLLYKNMVGTCVEGLDVTDDERIGIFYTDMFHQMLEHGHCQPGCYMLCVVRKANQLCSIPDWRTGIVPTWNQNFDFMVKVIGRSFRNLPSFIREPSLVGVLKQVFRGCECFCSTANDDKNTHTDIWLKWNKQWYHVWSYQSTKKGLANGVAKFSGGRGGLVDGNHILLPFDRTNPFQADTYLGWQTYNLDYIKPLLGLVESYQYDDYKDIMAKHKLDPTFLKIYMEQIHIVRK